MKRKDFHPTKLRVYSKGWNFQRALAGKVDVKELGNYLLSDVIAYKILNKEAG